MTPLPSNRDEAAELFIQMLIVVAYDGVLRDLGRILRDGPAGRQPPKDRVALHEWFVQLGERDQQMVLQAAGQATRSCIFDSLTLLDGVVGGLIREGKELDFALYLELYGEAAYRKADTEPETRFRLDPGRQPVDELHDIFNNLMRRRSHEDET